MDPLEPRTRFVHHQDRAIVLMDFSGLQDEGLALQIVEEARRFVATQPRVRNLLTLVDVSDSIYTPAIVDKLKELARHDEPWVIAGAAVGLNALRRLVLRIITTFSGRRFATFTTRQAAMDWLVRQEAPPAEVPEAWEDPSRPSQP